MSEKTKKPVQEPVEEEVEKEEAPAEKPQKVKAKVKPAVKDEKKPNFLVRGYRKVRDAMSKHPFWTAAGSAALGSAATVGIAKGVSRYTERRHQREYVPTQQNNDGSPFDPNV